jgi:hypothetical protein
MVQCWLIDITEGMAFSLLRDFPESADMQFWEGYMDIY